jgi:hypothetical protein
MYLSRSPLSKTPQQVFFNPYKYILTYHTLFTVFIIYTFFRLTFKILFFTGLMLKGDLLVEISQAENKKEQIVLQTKAMHCFIRAKHLCRWILKQNGFEDQATDVVANGCN